MTKIKTFILIILFLAITSPSYAWLENYAHRRIITIQDTNVGGNLTDFPLYIKVSSDEMGQLIDDTNFYDIRFTNDEDTVIAYDPEYADATIGHYWVKIASILADGGETVYMYYENSTSQTDGSDAAAVWSANYAAVWHFNEASWSGGAGEIKDSLGTNDGVRVGNATTTDTNAKIYRCGTFDGTSDSADFGTDTSIDDLFDGGGSITVWVRPDNDGESNSGRVCAKGDNDSWTLNFISESGASAKLSMVHDFNSAIGAWDQSSFATDYGAWNYIAVTYNNDADTNNAIHYVDGASVGSTERATPSGTRESDSAYDFLVGDRAGDDRAYDGLIDEVRLLTDIRTVDEVAFEYANMNENDQELTWGDEESAWLENYAHRKSIAVQDTNVDGNLTDFPLLVEVGSAEMSQLIDDTNFYDIRFTTSTGIVLDYEEEFADATEGFYWVKISSILATGGASIYMYYENSTAQTDGSDAANVWDANFMAVYHMKDTSDSTGNHALTNSGATSGATGKIDDAYSFSSTYLYTADHADFESANKTLSAWVNMTTAGSDDIIIGKESEYWLIYNSAALGGDANRYAFTVYDGDWVDGSGNDQPSTGTFYYATATFGGSGVEYFENGVSNDGPNAQGAPTPYSGTFDIGTFSSTPETYHFIGVIDEVRYSDKVREDEWIKFEYYNMNAGDNEITWGSEEPVVGGYGRVIIISS